MAGLLDKVRVPGLLAQASGAAPKRMKVESGLRERVLLGLALGGAVVLPVLASAPRPSPVPPSAPGAAAGQPRAEIPAAGLHRCIGADGAAIFTDRACRDLAATDAPPPSATNPRPAVVVRARSCARSQDALLFGVRTALEAHDPNKLAEYYHWTGMGNTEGYRLMGRLSDLSERPLLDVQLVSSAQVGTPMPPLPPPPPLDDEFSIDPAPSPPEPPPRTNADLLRVDQMRSETDVESQVTYFRLRNNAGCWWLQFQ